MKRYTADKLRRIASVTPKEALKQNNSSFSGLSPLEAEYRVLKKNISDKPSVWLFSIILHSIVNSFSLLLIVVAVFALVTGFLLKDNDNLISASIIFGIILISGIIQCSQNLRAHKSFLHIGRFSDTPVTVRRNGILVEIAVSKLVEGDIMLLSAGSRIPADLRLLSSKDLRVSQAAVTGESRIVKKNAEAIQTKENIPLPSYDNLIFRGSTIISGSGEALVLATGKDAFFGGALLPFKNNLKKGSGAIVKTLLGFMLFFVPAAFLVSVLLTKKADQALLFTLSVVVSLIPTMLPMVISVCFSKGSRTMMKKKTLVRNVDTMQGFAGMNVLCVDKTGTLTDNEINLEYYLDPLGRESKDTLTLAFLNSHFLRGAGNYIDYAIKKFEENPLYADRLSAAKAQNRKLDEIPFGYDRKTASVLLSDGKNNKLICKGNVDEVLAKCSYVLCGQEVLPMPQDKRRNAYEVIGELLSDGMKVLAVAQKTLDKPTLDTDDENDMILVGYLVFFDAPKKTAKTAIRLLKEKSVDVVVLTGDSAATAVSVCKRVGIDTGLVVKGTTVEKLDGKELKTLLTRAKIFAELTPDQKVKVVKGLQSIGKTVGYLGDGLNDVPALRAADVAISVDTAQDVVKDIADVLLLEKDLSVLADGITEGRKTFTNVKKYIKITTASNFGNALALIIASIVLPFQSMIAVQLLTLNILYDFLCFAISWDRVDEEELQSAKAWDKKGLAKFAVCFGTVSTVFDILTFAFLYYFFCPWATGAAFAAASGERATLFIALFQTGWFLESICTQIVALNILRTKKLPLKQSNPSPLFLSIMLFGICLFSLISFSPLGEVLGFAVLPPIYLVYLIVVIILYSIILLLVKKIYLRFDKELI